MRTVAEAIAFPPDAARPRLRGDLHLEVFETGQVVLFGEDNQHIFREKAYVELLPLLDGRYRLGELGPALKGRLSLPEIYYALNQLHAGGLVVWRPDDADFGRAAWADRAGLPAHAFTCAVDLITLAGADDALLRDQLSALGLPLAVCGKGLAVVLARDPIASEVTAFARQAASAGRPWLLVAETGRMGHVGPFFVPDVTACHTCLSQRMVQARQAETWLSSRAGGLAPRAPAIGTPASAAGFAAFAATQILRHLGTEAPPLAGRMLRRDGLTFETTEHMVTRRPQCPDCGTAVHPGPLVALDAFPQPMEENAGPARLEALVDPLCGVVHSVSEGLLTANERVHTALARHFFPMFKNDVRVLQHNLHGRSGGKGFSARAARTGALGEAVERFSGIWQGDWEAQRRGRQDLPGAVSLADLLVISDAQYAARAEWNRRLASPHQVVPDPLEPDAEIDWTPAWSLTHGAERLLPAAYCWYGHPELKRMMCLADSNGCAAASTRERALMKAVFELIERDAVALWWYPRLRRPGLDLAAFRDPELAALLARYAALGRDVWALDISTEFGLPVVVALSARRDGPAEDIIFGFGAGHTPEQALHDAVGEISQAYAYVSDIGRDGTTRYRAENSEMLDWLKSARRSEMNWLMPDPDADLRGPGDLPNPGWTSPADAVDALKHRLGAGGHELIALDQTRPDIGIPVMRAVAPGLRHFWRRLGPGRLYEAPVRLGWCDAVPAEADLNPYSVFI